MLTCAKAGTQLPSDPGAGRRRAYVGRLVADVAADLDIGLPPIGAVAHAVDAQVSEARPVHARRDRVGQHQAPQLRQITSTMVWVCCRVAAIN